MRFENNISQFASLLDDAVHSAGRTGLAERSPLAASRTEAQPDGLGRNPRQHVVIAASWWLLAQVIGGFASYTEAMNGVLSTRVAINDGGWQDLTKPSPQAQCARPDSVSPVGEVRRNPNVEGLGLLRTWSGRITRPISACWSRIRRESEIRSAIAELESLEDWALNDIGVPRCRIERVVRYGEEGY